MSLHFLRAVGLLLLATTIVTTTAFADPSGPYYVVPAIYLATADSKLKSEHDFGFQLSAGLYLSEHWQAELISESTKFKRDDGTDTYTQRGASLQGIFSPGDALVRPMLVGGFGWLHSTSSSSQSASRPLARLGLGFQSQIPDSSLGFRATAVWRHEFNSALTAPSSGLGAMIYSIGVSYRFGSGPVGSHAGDGSGYSGAQQSGVLNNAPATDHRVPQGTQPPQKDEDGDGVPDMQDKCSDTPPNVIADADGCPIGTQ